MPADPETLPDLSRGPATQERRRYPWELWAEPGSGPWLIGREDCDPHKLAGVLRTWSIRKSVPLRSRHVPEGLVFQFGPPFSPTLPDTTRRLDVPAADLSARPCPTCLRPLPPNDEEEPDA